MLRTVASRPPLGELNVTLKLFLTDPAILQRKSRRVLELGSQEFERD